MLHISSIFPNTNNYLINLFLYFFISIIISIIIYFYFEGKKSLMSEFEYYSL